MFTVMYDSTNDILAIYSPTDNILRDNSDFLVVDQTYYSLGYTTVIKNASKYFDVQNLYNSLRVMKFPSVNPISSNIFNSFIPTNFIYYSPINLGTSFAIDSKLKQFIPFYYEHILDMNGWYVFSGNFTDAKFYLIDSNNFYVYIVSNRYSPGVTQSSYTKRLYLYGNLILEAELDNYPQTDYSNKYFKIYDYYLYGLQFDFTQFIDKNSFILLPENLPKQFKLKNADIYFVI